MTIEASPRRRTRIMVALLCLILAVVAGTPCRGLALPAERTLHAAPGCSGCCHQAPVAAAKSCCEASRQPAQLLQLTESPTVALLTQALAPANLGSLVGIHNTAPAIAPAPPPLLHPILRI